MRLYIFIQTLCGLIYICAGVVLRTQSYVKPDMPAAEVSSVRLTTGNEIIMKCNRMHGIPILTYSANPRVTEFTEVTGLDKPIATGCGDNCLARVYRATFNPSLAGTYRCSSAVNEPFTIMWVNETLVVNQFVVKTKEYDKPLSLSCNANLLPAGVAYQRQIKWFVTNDEYHMSDVTTCCSRFYSIETTTSPGPSSLIIRNYDVSRDYGMFRCSVMIDGYGKELHSDTKIFAELDITFDITTGGRPTRVQPDNFVEIVAGELLNVTCIARGNPSPRSIRVLQNGGARTSDTVSFRGILRSSISVTNITEFFNDSFSCESRQDVINTPLSPPSITTITVFVRVVNSLSTKDQAAETEPPFLSGSAQIAVYVTIPLVTIIIVVVVVRFWYVRRSRLKNRDRMSMRECSSSNGTKPPRRAPLAATEWQQPLQSAVREDDRL